MNGGALIRTVMITKVPVVRNRSTKFVALTIVFPHISFSTIFSKYLQIVTFIDCPYCTQLSNKDVKRSFSFLWNIKCASYIGEGYVNKSILLSKRVSEKWKCFC